MRNRAWRRAQLGRMIEKARRSRTVTYRTQDGWVPHAGYLKSLANNMAICSCWMCTAHKRRPTREFTRSELQTDVLTRQQLKELCL